MHAEVQLLGALAAAALLFSCGGSSKPACVNTCSQAGAAQCSGNNVQTCTADSNGCLSQSSAACPSGKYCSGAACASCNNTCPVAGATQCGSDKLQVCTADPNGCLSFSVSSACASGLSCPAGATSCQAQAATCGGVTSAGICLDPQTVQFCAAATGQGLPVLNTHACAQGETCSIDGGTAHCKVTGPCATGATTCLDSTHLQTCNGGAVTTTACPNSCLTTALASVCSSSLATSSLTFTTKYTLRGPTPNYSDWMTTSQDVTISNLLVISYSGANVVDARTTDDSGSVTILVPSSPQPDDKVVLVAAASDGAGGLAFIVADPGFAAAGKQETNTFGNPRFWTWSTATTAVANGSTITIGENQGSGVLRIFDYLRYVYYGARGFEGLNRGLSLVVWVGYGTSWTCGSCFAPWPATLNNLQFKSQIWLDANLNDQRWWSDAVTAHELGHWVMSSYSTSPGEGGRHIFGVPSLPGLDWSEGWATFHSSFARGNSIYFDKQNGSMFWVDIATTHYSNTNWILPVASKGLLQLMDENEVSAMLWSITNNPAVGGKTVFTALSSAHMNTAPWGRGYTRHTWDTDPSGTPINVVDTHQPAPVFADFLDALECAGVAHSIIDAATVPATQYPYPSASPICP